MIENEKKIKKRNFYFEDHYYYYTYTHTLNEISQLEADIRNLQDTILLILILLLLIFIITQSKN